MKKIFREFFSFFFLFLLPFIFYLLSSPLQALEQKGMALGLFSKDPQYSYEQDLKEMKEWGITDVLLLVSWYQHDVKSNEIVPLKDEKQDTYTIPDEKLREVIQQAESLGIRTVIFPILRLEVREDKDWRGVIEPSDKDLWWKNYEKFILYYAEIAATEKVSTFSVGSELLSREKETEKWKSLIEKVRKIYPGKLLYSSNWDHYQYPEFWGSLDYIGMTAYHELSKTKKPSLKNLQREWVKIRREVLAWKKKYPRQKLVFTEIGYPSVDGTSMHPWNYFMEGKVDLREQALCYRAFINSWKKVPQLAGVYFWVWWGEGGPQDKSYTPRGKPAARYLQKWYKPVESRGK